MSSASVAGDLGIEGFSHSLPYDLNRAVKAARANWDNAGGTARLWKKDASLWTDAGEDKWLDWHDVVDAQLADISKFKALAAEIAEDGFRHLVLLGVGSASLCPEVFGISFGKQANAPELLVLDSTDPVQIKALRAKIDPARTLFCVSSKSGATFEPDLLLQYFFEEARKVVGENAGHHFVAVTDPGSPLEDAARKLGFRQFYHGLPGMGGGYSALSDFGLVPHAGMGLDTERLLKRTAIMVEACKNPDSERNPGVALGLILGAAAKAGRDKVTLLCSKSIGKLGAWLEQLLAQPAGKHGRGLVPVDREPVLPPGQYGKDRLFVFLSFAGDKDADFESKVTALEKSGEPVVRIVLKDLYDLGQTFFQWQIAAAVAASLMGTNPFHQPGTEAGKLAARALLSEFEEHGALPSEKPLLDQDGIQLFAGELSADRLLNGGHRALGGVIRSHLDSLKPGDYFGLLAYLPMLPEHEAKLQKIRKEIMAAKQVATVLAFGPKLLHGAGQAYLDETNPGVFLQITYDHAGDLPVPGRNYTFGLVKAAQARGDFQVLAGWRRRVLRIHFGKSPFGKDLAAGLEHLLDLVRAAVTH